MEDDLATTAIGGIAYHDFADGIAAKPLTTFGNVKADVR